MMRPKASRVLAGVAFVLGGVALSALGYIAFAMARIPDPPTRTLRLPSGVSVEVVDVGLPAEAPPTWHFEYRTRVPIRDTEGLANEVAALSAGLQLEAEHSGYSRVVVIPTNFSRRVVFDGWRPIIFSHASTALVLEKSGDKWKRTNGWPREYRHE